jgi:hypothetical protein
VKFSVITLYPNSTSTCPRNSRLSWEFGIVGVEYLFMGNFIGNAHGVREQIGQEQIGQELRDGHRDYGYAWISDIRISVLNLASKPINRSGWYRNKSAVLI